MNPNLPQTAAPRNDSFDVLTVFNPSPTDFPVYYNSELHAIIPSGKAIQLVKLIAGDGNHGAIKHLVDRMCKLQRVSKNEPTARSAWISKILINSRRNEYMGAPTLEEQAAQINKQLQNQPLDVPLPSINPPAAVNPSFATPPSVSPAGMSDQQYIDAGYKFNPVTGAPLKPAPVITPDQIDTSNVQVAPATLPIAAAMPNGVPAPLPTSGDPTTDNILAGIRGDNTADGEGKIIGEVTDEVDAPPAQFEKNWPDAPTKEDLMRYAQNVTMMNIDDEKTKTMLESQSVDELKKTLNYDVYA